MPVVAFLFNQTPQGGHLSDEGICAGLIRGLIAESTLGTPSSAWIRSGGLLLYRYAYRLVEIHEVQTLAGQTILGWVEQAKLATWGYLLADFAEALRTSWHLGDFTSIDSVLQDSGVAVYSAGFLELDTARRLHERLADIDGYLGASQVDLGNPVLYQVCWSGLIKRYQVVDTQLGFLDSWDASEDRWPLDAADDRWWHAVGASATYWTSPDDERRPHPDVVAPEPDSPRGAATRAALARLTTPTLMERLVKSIGPDELPPNTRSFSAEPIPGAADVIIPEEKLRGYTLNLDHPEGGPKARQFLGLLAITADDWRFLALQLRSGVRSAPAFRSVGRNEYGVRFDVITAVRGRNGIIKPVLSAWIVLPGKPPSLTTTYIAKRDAEPSVADLIDVPLLPREQLEDWESLWQVATVTAAQAAELTVPQPIHVSGPGDPGQWYLDGAEGAAIVRILNNQHGFTRWLCQRGFGSAHHQSGWQIPGLDRSYDTNVSWANAFAEVLDWHGINCEVIAFMT